MCNIGFTRKKQKHISLDENTLGYYDAVRHLKTLLIFLGVNSVQTNQQFSSLSASLSGQA